MALFMIGVAVCVYCGECGDSEQDILNRSFLFINGANGVDTARAEATADGETIPIGTSVAFGDISPKVSKIRNARPATYRGFGISSAFNATHGPRTVDRLNLVAATRTPAGDRLAVAAIHAMTEPVVMMIRDQGPTVDVYVTAPGADLAALQPDSQHSSLGVFLMLPLGTLHPNTAFQVRLTAAGTKNVLVDFGTQPALPAGTTRLLAALHQGNTLVTRGFTIDAR